LKQKQIDKTIKISNEEVGTDSLGAGARNPLEVSVSSGRIWLSPPHMSGREQGYIQQAFDSNWLAPLGPNVDLFERKISERTGAKHVAAFNSGTSAIHLALKVLGVGPGDFVICQSLTFAASANPVVYLGATPVFVDSEADTWNMDPEMLEKAILSCMDGRLLANQSGDVTATRKPKAIIPVHIYGMPAKMEQIMAIAKKYGIQVIEDAAEALGSSYKGKQCGTLGDIGIVSFNGNKIITTTAGGAMLSNNSSWIEKAKHLGTQAREDYPYYQHAEIGYNYRMSNVLAGMGCGQIEVLGDRICSRRNNFEYYRDQLSDIAGLDFVDEIKGHFSNRWLTCMLLDTEKLGVSPEDIRAALAKENIESRPLWKPMHLQPVYSFAPYFGTGVSERLFARGLCLPSGSDLTEIDQARIVKIIRTVLGVA